MDLTQGNLKQLCSKTEHLLNDVNIRNDESICENSERESNSNELVLTRKLEKEDTMDLNDVPQNFDGNERKDALETKNVGEICDFCGRTFKSEHDLSDHLKTHSGDSIFMCSVCQKCFSKLIFLERHRKAHVQMKNSENFTCVYCDKSFAGCSSLKVHLKSHLEKKFQCGECKKNFLKEKSFELHKIKHLTRSICEICGQSFRKSWILKKHLLVHTKDKPFCCQFCQKTFAQKYNYKEHLRIHTGEKPFLCGKCPKAFAHQSALSAHQITHSNAKPFACPVCHRRFSSKTILSRHGLTHSKEKSYSCEFCLDSFSRTANLHRHLLSSKMESPTVCNTCQSQFSYRCQLKKHFRTHSEDHMAFDISFRRVRLPGSEGTCV